MVTSFLKTLPTGKETATTIQVCLMLEEQKREEAKGKMRDPSEATLPKKALDTFECSLGKHPDNTFSDVRLEMLFLTGLPTCHEVTLNPS